MTRAKRDFGTIRKRANGRWQAYYMGPDQAFHRAPSTFEAKVDAEAWLAAERRLMQNDEWSPSKSRRATVVRSTEMFGPYAEAWLEQRELKPRTRVLYRRQLDRFLLPEWLIARLEAECLMSREAIHATFRAFDPPAPLPLDRIAERCAELTLGRSST